ncbi:helix-turn-helix domain-containing protein [Pseudonocardia sp.]|jgi:AcrR family transcriptional regulator|uniref:TetR/AcrR family transcriptional regulator n=1 Tax=Pseudonocardia sp. TaxID=60912 RepID=UPI002DA50C7B|nr:helix-turn-helix domain-containing protein [Pseudonocardia sp.]
MSAKDELLAAALEHVTAHGVGALTLRRLAAELGTSHRMLIYHFGSWEGLLVAIVQAVEQRQRDRLRALLAEPDLPPGEQARRFWAQLVDPAQWPSERLFFELYGQALQGRPHAVPLLDGVVDDWLDPLTELTVRSGVPRAEARAHARLRLAVARGLLLDLLATGDVEGVRAAAEVHAAAYRPA